MEKPNIPTNKEFQKQRNIKLLKFSKNIREIAKQNLSIAEVETH